MLWTVSYTVSVAVVLAAITAAILLAAGKYKRGRVFTPFNVLFGGLFIAVVLMLVPIYGEMIEAKDFRPLKVIAFSLHDAFQIFTIDADKEIILESIHCPSAALTAVYAATLSVEFVVAPLLSFGFLISFFKNIFVYGRYLLHWFGAVYVFSELNERSLALAGDLRKNHKHAVIVFTDVFRNSDETGCEQAERAREIGALCFKKDILSINFRRHCAASEISFFTIGEDEVENIAQSLRLIRDYGSRDNTRLYAFSTRVESELTFTQANKGKMKVRRVNDVRSRVSHILYEEGHKLFETAAPQPDGTKEIGALIVGMGGHGGEMLRALAWYGQMDGYRIRIDAFDSDPLAEDRFAAACPELMSPAYNGVYVPGEAQYKITVHPGVETSTKTFADAVAALGQITYVLVALGNDEVNIRTAVELRTLFERLHMHPMIQAIVYSSEEKAALTGVVNFRGQAYDIELIGDLKTTYSEEMIIDSRLEAEALARHLKWGKEEEFWQYEYNYRSSLASAIHMKARVACGIPGADKPEAEVTEEDQIGIERLEHRRWNAYMRSEGYVYSGSHEKSSRNDLGKMHHDLVNYEALDEAEKRKDFRVGTT
jgi:hypothetical protein